MGEEAEDCGTDVQRRVGGDLLLRQADVEGLVEAPARLRAQREQPFRERQPCVGRAEGAVGEQPRGDAVEDPVPLGVDRGEVGLGVEDAFDDHIAFLGELRTRVRGCQRHRDLPSGIGSSDSTRPSSSCGRLPGIDPGMGSGSLPATGRWFHEHDEPDDE